MRLSEGELGKIYFEYYWNDGYIYPFIFLSKSRFLTVQYLNSKDKIPGEDVDMKLLLI